MDEATESGIICNKVKAGEQCVYSKSHICDGEKCKPYPCGYFREGFPNGQYGYRFGYCSVCNKVLIDVRIPDGTPEPEAYCKEHGIGHNPEEVCISEVE
jgi:hypothetical protein